MEVTGRIILALPEVSGVSKAGNNWHKKEYVLETQETYPKRIYFDLFGERADQFPLEVGQTVKLFFDIESREYQGRWFTSIRGWKVEPFDPNAPVAAAAPAAQPYAAAAAAAAPAAYGAPAPAQNYGTVPPPPAMEPAAPNDDLPF